MPLSCSASLALLAICLLWSQIRNLAAPGWIPGTGDRGSLGLCEFQRLGLPQETIYFLGQVQKRPWRCQASLETNQTLELQSKQLQLTPEQRGLDFLKSARTRTCAVQTRIVQGSTVVLILSWELVYVEGHINYTWIFDCAGGHVDHGSTVLPSRIFCYWSTICENNVFPKGG